MDCLPRGLPVSAFSGTQLSSVESQVAVSPQAPGTGTMSGLYVPVSSVPSRTSGTTNGQETLGLMTAVSPRMAQAAGGSWLIKARSYGDSFPQLGDTLFLLRQSEPPTAGLLQCQETQAC